MSLNVFEQEYYVQDVLLAQNVLLYVKHVKTPNPKWYGYHVKDETNSSDIISPILPVKFNVEVQVVKQNSPSYSTGHKSQPKIHFRRECPFLFPKFYPTNFVVHSSSQRDLTSQIFILYPQQLNIYLYTQIYFFISKYISFYALEYSFIDLFNILSLLK